MPALAYTAYSGAAKKISSGHNKPLKRPSMAPAYTSGGSTHRVKVGKAAGCHPHIRRAERQPRWSNKRGLGRLSALHAHVLPKPYASVLSIQHTYLSVLGRYIAVVYTPTYMTKQPCVQVSSSEAVREAPRSPSTPTHPGRGRIATPSHHITAYWWLSQWHV